ncbi:hypothetical protein BDR06DRAFT_962267 [Suillus hirtellus]|nr:hypothetical protein BDR06DRAFT_962267 [Suillus hirtellus]
MHLSLKLGAEGSCIILAPALPSNIPHIYWFIRPGKVVAARGRCIVAATHLSLKLGAEGSCIISVPALSSDIPHIYWFIRPGKVVAARGRCIVAATHLSLKLGAEGLCIISVPALPSDIPSQNVFTKQTTINIHHWANNGWQQYHCAQPNSCSLSGRGIFTVGLIMTGCGIL